MWKYDITNPVIFKGDLEQTGLNYFIDLLSSNTIYIHKLGDDRYRCNKNSYDYKGLLDDYHCTLCEHGVKLHKQILCDIILFSNDLKTIFYKTLLLNDKELNELKKINQKYVTFYTPEIRKEIDSNQMFYERVLNIMYSIKNTRSGYIKKIGTYQDAERFIKTYILNDM